jgi:hypothetical protein
MHKSLQELLLLRGGEGRGGGGGGGGGPSSSSPPPLFYSFVSLVHFSFKFSTSDNFRDYMTQHPLSRFRVYNRLQPGLGYRAGYNR